MSPNRPECHLNDKFGTFKGPPVWWNVLESTEKGRHYRCKHVFEKDDDGNPQKYCTTEISTGPTVNISNLYAHCQKGHWSQTSPTAPERDDKGEIVIPDPDAEEDEAGIVITKGDVRNYFGAIPKKKKKGNSNISAVAGLTKGGQQLCTEGQQILGAK